ncbi:MAG: DUF4203 domain-containing protein [Tissierellia bacterium]|nr:DUF4203 domain-containing protein [Tissierellia bacterium]
MIAIIFYILLSVLIGAASLFFGKRLYFPILMLSVFIAVFTISFSLFNLTWPMVLTTFAIALISALLAKSFYKLGLFLIGSILGFGLIMILSPYLPGFLEKYSWILGLISALIAGFCAVRWYDVFIIASTSFNGAYAIATSAFFLFKEFNNLQSFIYRDGLLPTVSKLNQYLNNQFLTENVNMIFILTLTISIIGFVIQFKMDRNIR